ncbi:atrial natriuretic peptide-converting enzyme isoform X1 [Tachysurus ichikawai]
MATLVSNVAVTMDDNLDDVNTTTAISSENFHPQSPSTDPLISDSSSFSSSSFPLDATPTPTADWLMSFSTLNDLSSVEPTRTNSEPEHVPFCSAGAFFACSDIRVPNIATSTKMLVWLTVRETRAMLA